MKRTKPKNKADVGLVTLIRLALVMCFADLTKAYYNVPVNKLWKVLKDTSV